MFEDGLVRLATEEYTEPNDTNCKNLFMHLTNYAINKNSKKFVENNEDSDLCGDEEEPHKRDLKQFFIYLKARGHNIKKLKEQINDICIKTCLLACPSISHVYRSCQSDDVENALCFQILGFDIMLDSKLKPWLLEVNQSPSFATASSALDERIKS